MFLIDKLPKDTVETTDEPLGMLVVTGKMANSPFKILLMNHHFTYMFNVHRWDLHELCVNQC